MGKTSKKEETTPVDKAVMAWYNEVLSFNVANIEPFKFVEETGHYTQLAWADTYKVIPLCALSVEVKLNQSGGIRGDFIKVKAGRRSTLGSTHRK